MNIFALSKCPIESAQQMLDKHVVKMPTESCQMLHTNTLYFQYLEKYGTKPSLRDLKQFHACSQSKLMKPAMLNHPSTIWARENQDTFVWLYAHAVALCEEYSLRYRKVHGAEKRILDTPNKYFSEGDTSKAIPVFIAMFDEYRIPNTFLTEWEYVIQSYRHYYLEGKWKFAEWRNNRRPAWFPANQYAIKYNEYVRDYNARKPKMPLKEMKI